MILPIFLMFLVTVIESTIVFAPLTFVSIAYMAIVFDFLSIESVFVAGILLDIWQNRHVGVNSLFFLASIAIWQQYGKKFYAAGMAYQIVYLIVTLGLYIVIFYRIFSISTILSVIGVSVGVFILLKKMIGRSLYKKKLSI